MPPLRDSWPGSRSLAKHFLAKLVLNSITRKALGERTDTANSHLNLERELVLWTIPAKSSRIAYR